MAQAQLPEFISFEDLKSGAHIKMLRQLIRKYEEGKIGSRDFERAQEACHAFAQTPGFLFGKSKAQSLMPASGSGVSGHKIEHNCMLFVSDADANERYAHTKQNHIRPVSLRFELVANKDGTGFYALILRPFPVLISAQHVKQRLLDNSGAVSDFIDNSTVLASCMALLEARICETDPNLPELGGIKPFYIPHTSGLLMGHAIPIEPYNILNKGIGVSKKRVLTAQNPDQQKAPSIVLLGLPTGEPVKTSMTNGFLSSSSAVTGKAPSFSAALLGPKVITTEEIDLSPLWNPQFDMEIRTYVDVRRLMGGQKEIYGRLHAATRKGAAFYEPLLTMMHMFTVGDGFEKQRLFMGGPAASVNGAKEALREIMTSQYWRSAGLRAFKDIARRLAPREPA